jgi:hypothetical protein
MNKGLKSAIKNILSSTDPAAAAMKIMDVKFGNNPRWQQAKQMAESGNAKEKAKNFFSERGVDIESIVNNILNDIK